MVLMRISFLNPKTGKFIITVGMVVVGIAFLNFYDNFKFLKKAVRGNGRVVSIERLSGGGKRYRDFAEIQFMTSASQLFKLTVPAFVFDQNDSANYSTRLMVGQSVT